ncbi:MAG: TM1802 family CRISPR-associated protein [Deinococcales bacterium]
MLEDMLQLALQYLYKELDGIGEPEAWYNTLRAESPEKLFPFLIEAARDSMAKNFYVLMPDPNNPDTALLEAREFDAEVHGSQLPFVQSTGSQSPALGPVLKRSFNKDKGGGPSAKILLSTIQAFDEIAQEEAPWSNYFAYAHALCSRFNLCFEGKLYCGTKDTPALVQAVRLIPEKVTAFLSILDSNGRLPGERSDYRSYLQTILAIEKYSTVAIKADEGIDSLTNQKDTVYPNALSGAGVNLSNVDRAGVFSGLLEENAHKKFALSAASADLLYTFNFHLRPKFIGSVAGESALILPTFQAVEANRKKRFLGKFEDYVAKLKKTKTIDESEDRLTILAQEQDAIAGITIIWASFGQKLEDVTGFIQNVLPSRLTEISRVIEALPNSPVFPRVNIPSLEPDIAFNFLQPLLKRPGGAKTKKLNASSRLSALRRDIAASVYHGTAFPLEVFWAEALTTAKEYLADALKEGNTYGLTNEGESKKGGYLTLAGFVKHITKLIFFAKKLGILEEDIVNRSYTPHSETAKTFFANAQATAGLNTDAKCYAFLIGAYFGRLLAIQEQRGVNAGANALTWLKRLDLTGKDLPEIYKNTRGKLLEYENDTKELIRGMARGKALREINEEIALLGARIGSDITLSSVDTAYFLLLGQALHRMVMPKKEG